MPILLRCTQAGQRSNQRQQNLNKKNKKKQKNMKSMKTIFKFTLLALAILSQSSCASLLGIHKKSTHQGTIYLKNDEQQTGIVTVPNYKDKKVSIEKGETKSINSADIDRIVLDNPNKSFFRYMPTRKIFGGARYGWVLGIIEDTNASAYFGSEHYEVTSAGSVQLVGKTTQIIQGNMHTGTIQPSFPVFMMKPEHKFLTQVALKGGVSNESSAFRAGVSRFLADDPTLMEYMRQEKWGIYDIPTLIQNYNPNRGNNPLTINGVIVQPKKKPLITKDLNDEVTFYFETALPLDENYGTQFGFFGVRNTKWRFFTFGGDIGYASARYVDRMKRIDNHGVRGMDTAWVIKEDFATAKHFRFNFFAGLQLPFDLNKFYLVPGAAYTFGGTFGTEYVSAFYGQMATLDFGFKLKHGSILFVGTGYRLNTPIKKAETREEESYPGFEAYKPYGNLLFRIGYKW
jgi:hypothetical protein